MKKIIITIATFIFLTSAAFASDSSHLVPTVGKNAMRQEIGTTKDESSATISPTAGGELSCPDGYALSLVKQSAQQTADVVVNRECNGTAVTIGIGIPGYAHVWCDSAPDTYRTVTQSPTANYVCRKLENRWTDAMVAGVRD